MNRTHSRARLTGGVALLGSAALVAGTLSAPATADPVSADHRTPTARQAAKAENGTVLGTYEHLIRLDRIARRHGDTRASGTPGYRASRNYVVRTLKRSGYKPKVQGFDFPYFEQQAPSTFERTSPPPTQAYPEDDPQGFYLMTFSGSGDVTAAVQNIDLALANPTESTSGCEPEDFADFTAGNVALIQRGACSFGQKAQNATDAGAAGVIIFNQGDDPGAGRQEAFAGTLGGVVEGAGPVIGTSFAIGEQLAAAPSEVHLAADTLSETRRTWNVTAQTKQGNRQNVVMAGAHLDSVLAGHGINDNGSGTAALLETAQQLADMKRKPRNQVRFAWWGAEELGLLGSEHYVADLSENHPRRFQNIALYLNYDMVGSPNYMLGVYDGNDSLGAGTEPPAGSAAIERMYQRYFERIGTGSVETEFSGRSDYGPFIALNVPAGGLFTGAEGTKTAEEAAMFGGTAGEPYDACYHQACDDLGNLSYDALKANLGAIVHATKKYARSTRSVNGKRTGHQPPPPAARSALRGATGSQAGPDHAAAR